LRSKDLKDWPTLREKMEMAVLCALDSWLLMTTPKERWRVGNKVGRTLYLEGKLVGMVDTEELAKAIVERMNEE
jgi:hypothetical protein